MWMSWRYIDGDRIDISVRLDDEAIDTDQLLNINTDFDWSGIELKGLSIDYVILYGQELSDHPIKSCLGTLMMMLWHVWRRHVSINLRTCKIDCWVVGWLKII